MQAPHASIAGFSMGTSENMSILVPAGLVVKERNWMEVFPWARWGGNDNLPPFELQQTFMPTELLLKEVRPKCHQHCTTTLLQSRKSSPI